MNPEYIFLSPAPMPRLTDCGVKSFGRNEYHCSRYCECFVLIFMMSSRLKFTEDSVLTTLGAGEWYIQQKNMWQDASLPSPNAEYYYLHFEAEYTSDMLNRIRLPVRGVFRPALFMPCLKKIISLFSETPQNHLEIQSEFFRLLNMIYTQEKAYTSLTSSVMGFLNENYASRITAQSLSSRFNYSPEYINKRLKAEIGITAHMYLHTVRMQNAVKMLERSEHSIQEIADRCGFSDISLFYKAFRKTYGESPSEYRKKHQFLFGQNFCPSSS